MFRLITALVLLIAFGAQTFQQAVIVLDYYVNTSAYSKNCENKAIPTMHCNGKCQMMKNLKQQEKQDQQNPERKTESKNEVISSQSFFGVLPLASGMIIQSHYFIPNTGAPVDQPCSFFHPPSA